MSRAPLKAVPVRVGMSVTHDRADGSVARQGAMHDFVMLEECDGMTLVECRCMCLECDGDDIIVVCRCMSLECDGETLVVCRCMCLECDGKTLAVCRCMSAWRCDGDDIIVVCRCMRAWRCDGDDTIVVCRCM
jgi:hypothetical protein